MQTTCSTDRIVQFSAIRVIACCAIVVLHTVFAANEYFADSLTQSENLLSRITENNMMWAVPLFLMVTGALQLRAEKPLTWRKLYGKYISRVFAALVVFSVLFRLFDIVMDGESFSPGSLLGVAAEELLTGRGWGHLWYLYLLIGIYVLLPFYRMIAQKCSKEELCYLAGVYLIFTSFIPAIESFGVNIAFYISESLVYPLYLFAGYMLYEEIIRIPARTALLAVFASTAAITALDVMKYMYGIEVPGVFFGYSSPLVIVQAAGLFSLLIHIPDRSGRMTSAAVFLDPFTFGIYLVSMLYVRLLFRYIRFNPYDGIPAILLTGSVILIFALSCVTTAVLKKIPGFRKLL